MKTNYERKGDWLLWLNNFGYIQVECSECGYRIPSDERIPDVCPKCGAVNVEEDE